ncbi:TonB-dependent receptor [Pedobacter sp. Hv1]|uniref:SusC/RagA family TonB-linked outer membrane protein n=1 Tax=Pedobacter sp. Hv1 TaxID=1740090 RepID=UPI0006D8AB9B|nr:TonB-dependent receptor [Pedobacter sp. Hv1]KQC01179.1 SusC/RagA family TonB-linked outer membrane protein [Pedobacter sp. Hv1]
MRKILFKRILQKLPTLVLCCFFLQINASAISAKSKTTPNYLSNSTSNFALAKAFLDISGVVTDSKGLALPGVGIKVKGTQKVAVTDEDGKFMIRGVDKDAILVFTSIGFKTKEVTVGEVASLKITLEDDAQGLNEVVVVGYGTQKKVNLTGAVTAISGAELMNRPVPNVTSALQGRVAGVVITRNSGQPGQENYGLRIRGTNSINGSAALVLVDGIEMDLNLINPDDVDNISFLKDAAASAIYGARAAGGVVLVTTKKSTSGKTRVNFNSYYSINVTARQPQRLNSWDEQTLIDEARFNATGAREFTPEQIEWLKNPNFNYRPNLTSNRWEYFDNTDWIKAGMSTVNHAQNHSVSVGGGSKELNYLLSGSFQTRDGVLRYGPDDNSRYNFKLNLNTELNKYVNIGLVAGYIGQVTNSNSFSTGNIVSALYRVRTRQSLYTPPEDTTGQPYNGDLQINAVDIEKNAGFTRSIYESFTGKVDVTVKNFIKGLSINAVAWRNQDNYNYEQDRRSLNWYGRSNTEAPRFSANVPNGISLTKNRGYHDNLQTTATYDFKLGNKHNFTILGGAAYDQYRKDEISAGATNLYSNDSFSLNFSDLLNRTNGDNVETYAFGSLFGRFNYNYDEKYLFESTVRYDGSSRLAPSSRWNLFPSFSAGWRISEENFFKGNVPVVSNLKLRASWGQVGNAVGTDIGNYDYIATLNSGSALVLNGLKTNYFFQNVLPSLGKTWETVQSSNIGVDLGMFKERLTSTVEFYNNRNKNMLILLNKPNIIGIDVSKTNSGELESWGWEAELKWRDRIGNFGYNIGVNFSDNQNKLIKMAGKNLIGTGGVVSAIEGYPLNSVWGYKTDGIFQTAEEANAYKAKVSYPFFANPTAGDIKYLDLNGDGVINAGGGTPENSGDLVYLGNTSARYSYGFDVGASWKGFDFSVAFQGTLKRSFLIATETLAPLNGTANMPWTIHMDRWTPDNPNAFFPRMYQTSDHNYKPSDRWTQNGSYIRLKNLQLGYKVPFNKKYIQNVRIYFSGQDLWESTKVLSVFDPEVSNGVNSQAYPFYRSFAFGLNVTL